MEQRPKNKVRERLFRLKHEIYKLGGNMSLIVGDLEWYHELKKNGQTGAENPGLWEVMNKEYFDFSTEELENLINQLQAD